MYIGVDVGGTKTLVATLDDNGVIIEQSKFSTPQNYQNFLGEVKKAVASFNDHEFVGGSVGVPATRMDLKKGLAIRFSNLQWVHVAVARDLEEIIGCPMFMENDAKLGGLSESMLVKDEFSVVLYLTLGTGIGYAVIDNQKIDNDAGTGGGRIMLVNRDGKLVSWESIASGHAIRERYGKMAKDITDPKIWEQISHDLAEGLEELISVFQPEVIIVGGGVGKYFDKFAKQLGEDIRNYHLPLVNLPKLKAAQRPDEAVIYGCYDYAKQQLNK